MRILGIELLFGFQKTAVFCECCGHITGWKNSYGDLELDIDRNGDIWFHWLSVRFPKRRIFGIPVRGLHISYHRIFLPRNWNELAEAQERELDRQYEEAHANCTEPCCGSCPRNET